MNREFSQAACGELFSQERVLLFRCSNCGFGYFNGSLAGNSAFYQELQHDNYYAPSRPEFARTVQFARRHNIKRVLDVGCGDGAFLDLAKSSGLAVAGMELNPRAAQIARDKGHPVFEKLLGEITPAATGGPFDLVSLFQVLEHVRNPVAVVREAANMLSPGGWLTLAVPSDHGALRLNPLDPHQWPPHHVSRWRLKDFETLSRVTGLRLVERGGDVLLGSGLCHNWKMSNTMRRAIGRRPRPGGDWLPPLLGFLYRKTGAKFIFPAWGNSIFAFLQKQQ